MKNGIMPKIVFYTERVICVQAAVRMIYNRIDSLFCSNISVKLKHLDSNVI